MDPNQRTAMDEWMKSLVEDCYDIEEILFNQFEINGVLDREECELVQRKKKSKGIKPGLMALFGILELKPNGWASLIEFATEHHYNNLAEKLSKRLLKLNPKRGSSVLVDLTSEIVQFTKNLADYYDQIYSTVTALFGPPIDINSVWIPPIIEKIAEPTDHFSHQELLERMKNGGEAYQFVLIGGDPGAGKTTLIQKISYEWAQQYKNNSCRFPLVISVPVRSLKETDCKNCKDILEMSVSFWLKQLNLGNLDTKTLINQIDVTNLLICLDGLDEAKCKSPLTSLFAENFATNPKNSTELPPPMKFRMIITSRPYAFRSKVKEFTPIQLKIGLVDESQLSSFAERYCRTNEGVNRAAHYLNTSSIVVPNPLILSMVCYMADNNENIPDRLTLLYRLLIQRMLFREHAETKLNEDLSPESWMQSKVVQSTAKLAFEACCNRNFEFSDAEREKHGVTNDSFIAGFLLYRHDPVNQKVSAEFRHLTFQEFFAALYSHELTRTKKKRHQILSLIRSRDSLVGRFLFGMCSEERELEKAMDWLKPSTITWFSYTCLAAANRREMEKYNKGMSSYLKDCSNDDPTRFVEILAQLLTEKPRDWVCFFGFQLCCVLMVVGFLVYCIILVKQNF